MKKIVIIKTGDTFGQLIQTMGDFESWIIKGMDLSPLDIKIVNAQVGERLPGAGECSGVVITGSHAMITNGEDWSLLIEKWVRDIVSEQVPLLGICYGHQLLARAMGGVVDYHPKGLEAGTTQVTCLPAAASDPLFRDLPKTFDIHVSHSQSVVTLPENAVLLAFNNFEPHHAFRVGGCAWGLQFHPEYDEQIMTVYINKMRKAIEKAHQDPDKILSKTGPTPLAAKILKRFSQLAQKDLDRNGSVS